MAETWIRRLRFEQATRVPNPSGAADQHEAWTVPGRGRMRAWPDDVHCSNLAWSPYLLRLCPPCTWAVTASSTGWLVAAASAWTICTGSSAGRTGQCDRGVEACGRGTNWSKASG